MSSTIESQIRQFIEDNFLFLTGNTELSNSESLLDAGMIDSTGVLELVSFLEETWQFTVEDNEIIPDNMDSVDKITAYVSGKADTSESLRKAS